MSTSTSLTALDGSAFEDPHLYRSIIGSLQYLWFTHFDISFDVNRACQYMHNPQLPHLQIVKRILHYLKLTSNLGLHFFPISSFTLSTFSDFDWVEYPNNRKSTCGLCVYFGSLCNEDPKSNLSLLDHQLKQNIKL